MEKRLIADKKIIRSENGTYILMSLEAVRGGKGGELAQVGDWFKVEEKDGELYPYPIRKEFFIENYRHIKDDDFEAVPKILDAWFADDQIISEEIQWLLASGKLRLTNDPKKFFIAEIWGTTLSAPKNNTVLIFYSVKRNDINEISEIDFNLVDYEAFKRDYILLE
jgi:hypothetical protein